MLKKIIVIAMAVVLSVVSFVGCSGDSYGRVKIEGKQDTSYTVTSQGGSAVRYGNYVYFINGNRGYVDSTGTNNVFGDVIKGAVYRAELLGEKSGGDFIVKRDSVTKLNFRSHVEKDYKNDDENVVDVQSIAPKTVGTSSYSGGGLFIFDDCLYYASPNNLKNKTGNVQYDKTDFFRMTLDGKTTQKLYTTQNDSSSSPYMFYSVGKYVYLTVLDGTDLISVKINKKSGKKEDTLKIADNVTSAVMGTKPVYYSEITENTIYDFIVFERAATKDDTIPSGEVLELIRPDGSSRTIFAADGKSDYVLEGMRDGYLYYRQPKNYSSDSVLYATNLHSALCSDAAYKADPANASAVNIDKAVLNISGLSGYNVYAFAPGYVFGTHNDYCVNVITVTNASASSSSSSETTLTATIYVDGSLVGSFDSGSAITVSATDGDTVYYNVGSTLKRLTYTNGASTETIAENITQGAYGADVIDGYVVYFGKINDDADAYTFFYEINGLEGVDAAKFVGELAEGDELSSTESLVVISKPNKTTYNVGDELDITGLVVEAVSYKDSEGNRPANVEIEIDDDMLSGFDSSAAGASTVTVTYDKKTVTFDVTIVDPDADSSSSV